MAIADKEEKELKELGAELIKAVGETNVIIAPLDVANEADIVRLRDRVYDAWGEVRMPWMFPPRLSVLF